MLAFLLMMSVGFADEAIPPEVEKYFRLGDMMREQLIAAAKHDHNEQIAKPKPKKGQKLTPKQIKEHKEKASAAADVFNEKIKKIESDPPRPWIAFQAMKDGSIGPFRHNLKVVQVIDGTSFLASWANETAMIRGVSTKSFSDGKVVTLDGVFHVNGNTSYTAVSGAKRTVLLIERFDESNIEKHREAWRTLNPLKPVEEIEAKPLLRR